MSKIGIYSDVHISRTSGILPTYSNDSKYTTRLNMCKDSLIFANSIFSNNSVNRVINCGDTFNNHTLYSDEITLYQELLNECLYMYEREYCLIGNHDKYNNLFSVMSLHQNNINAGSIDLFHYESIDNVDIYYMSYCESNEFNDLINNMFSEYPRKHKKAILFMHGDINGSTLVGLKKIEFGIEQATLIDYFDLIINGHIHCHEVLYNKDNKKIINIGSLTTHSFADSNKHMGACYILDINTFELISYINPYQILFLTYSINTKNELIETLNEIKNKMHMLKYDKYLVLKIKCPYELKDDVNDVLSSENKCLKFKLVFIYVNNEIDENDDLSETGDISIATESLDTLFIKFLKNRDDLKGNINQYSSMINEVCE